MGNTGWTRDILVSNGANKLPIEQRVRYELIRNVEHIVNSALVGKREISTGRCTTLQYSEFIELVYGAYVSSAGEMNECCADGGKLVLLDNLMRIADFAYAAIKNIVNNPSRTIKKVEVKVPSSRAKNFGSQTTRWLSGRPGLTIAEKLAPDNKILTTKTVFTVDTKENREFMYLYKRVNEIVGTRFVGTECAQCVKYHDCGRGWVSRMKKLSAAYSRLKTAELGEVKGEKQAVQNNKLMCDMNYKMIWDAVKELSHIEDNIEKENATLYERFAQVVYWALLGRITADKRAAIVDCIGAVSDGYESEEDGVMRFIDAETGEPHLKDVIIFKDENEKYVKTLITKLNGTLIEIVDGQGDGIYVSDVRKSIDV